MSLNNCLINLFTFKVHNTFHFPISVEKGTFSFFLLLFSNASYKLFLLTQTVYLKTFRQIYWYVNSPRIRSKSIFLYNFADNLRALKIIIKSGQRYLFWFFFRINDDIANHLIQVHSGYIIMVSVLHLCLFWFLLSFR